MYYIGFDLGTSSLKTTVIDEAKTIVYEASYGYHIEEPMEGYREIDPEVWMQTVMLGMRDILLSFDAQEISVMGVTGQMHSTVFLDEHGRSVRKAILWNDLRSASMVEDLVQELSKIEETRYIARILSPGNPALSTLWLKDNEPKVFAQVRKIMTAYDYLVYRLTGTYSADYCDASTSGLFDIATKKWSTYMLHKLGIKESYLGPLHASCDVVGTLLPELGEALRCPYAIRVIAGTGDNPANAVAMGIVQRVGQPVISLGTSGVVIMVKRDHDFEGVGKNVLCNLSGDAFVNVVQGTVRSAGGTHIWWVENILESEDMAIDQQRIEESSLGKNSILFFPHITGDKLNYGDLMARGAFLGLSAHTNRVDMLQALFEGVSFALRQVLDNMFLESWPRCIQINGGGTKSQHWMNILANVLHTELEVVTSKATPSYGVSLLARMVDRIEDEVDVVNEGTRYLPNEEMVKDYAELYENYKRIYGALKDIMQ